MYEYTWYQWLSFFYIYCFFGWIFESTYVSLKQHRFVNRGFLRLPMLPLYGTGAVMMLWVSLPFKSSLVMVYISGVIGATILEYVTGWGMERLFKMKYWDYSNQRFNLNGYICLSSSVAWGFLTIFLTEVIHKPIERWVLHVPTMIGIPCLSVITVVFIIDTAESVRTALDLAKVLDAMTKMKAELDDVQVQLALLKAETEQKLEEAKEDTAMKLETLRVEAAGKAAQLRNETAERAAQLKYETTERAAKLRLETALKAAQLKEHSITRRYQAIVHGVLKDDTGTIDAPIGRHPTDRKKMSINYNHGKNAVTHYKVLKRFRQYTHVECRLETGRTHQIRVHMASIGHPLLGDVVYGPGKCPIAGLEGQTLHAGILGFIHPRTGEYMEFTAPLPEYFEKLLNTLPE